MVDAHSREGGREGVVRFRTFEEVTPPSNVTSWLTESSFIHTTGAGSTAWVLDAGAAMSMPAIPFPPVGLAS